MIELELATAAVVLGLVVCDVRRRRRRKSPGYQRRDTLCSIWLGSGYLLTWLSIRASVLAVFVALANHLVIADLIIDGPVGWVITFLGVDLGYYCFHRFMHRTNLTWAAHAVHHSSPFFNYATAVRGSAVEPVIEPWFHLWMVFIGGDPLVIFTTLAIVHAYQFWVHTDEVETLGILDWFLVTPSHHRVHHASNPEYLDRNFGGVLIIWDRLFGTFARESLTPRFGLVKPIRSRRPAQVLLLPFLRLLRGVKQLGSFSQRIHYLLASPAERELV